MRLLDGKQGKNGVKQTLWDTKNPINERVGTQSPPYSM